MTVRNEESSPSLEDRGRLGSSDEDDEDEDNRDGKLVSASDSGLVANNNNHDASGIAVVVVVPPARVSDDDGAAATAASAGAAPTQQQMQNQPANPNGEGGISNSTKEPTFPVKLHMILSNPSFQDIIGWLPHGRSWRIVQQKAFEETVIPLYFRHGRYSSFARQVNGWGFRRICQGSDFNSYWHDLFLRGMPHLCRGMKRLTSKDSLARSNRKPEDETPPDFYAISREHPLPDLNGEYDGARSDAARVRSPIHASSAAASAVASRGLGEYHHPSTASMIYNPPASRLLSRNNNSSSSDDYNSIEVARMELDILERQRADVIRRLQQQQQEQEETRGGPPRHHSLLGPASHHRLLATNGLLYPGATTGALAPPGTPAYAYFMPGGAGPLIAPSPSIGGGDLAYLQMSALGGMPAYYHSSSHLPFLHSNPYQHLQEVQQHSGLLHTMLSSRSRGGQHHHHHPEQHLDKQRARKGEARREQ